MKRLLPLFPLLFIIGFSCTSMLAQEYGSVNSLGEAADPNAPLPPASLNGVLYLYPNYPPTYAQAVADGACHVVGGGNSESVTVTLAIPASYPNCGLADFGWVHYYFTPPNNCPPFTFSFSLSEGGTNIPKDSGTGLYPVKPGRTYNYTMTVSTGNATCHIDRLCPTPMIVQTSYSIEHSRTAGSTTELVNTYSSSNNGAFQFKVGADGSQASLFEIKMSNNFPGNGCANDFLLRLEEDTTANNQDQYGSFGPPIPTATGAKFEYTHPKMLPMSAQASYMEYTLQMIDATDATVIIKEIPFRVYRTPVLMVHGLWSNDEAFEDMKHELEDDYYEDFLLHRSNYGTNAAGSFASNAGVVLNGINFLLNQVKKEKVVVQKVDLIGHSMGGILIRLYQQSGAYNQNISRIITLNTPHAGSQLANALRDAAYARQQEARTLLRGIGNDPDGQAIDDLSVTSNAINQVLNGGNQYNNPLRSYAITTTDVVSCPWIVSSWVTRGKLCLLLENITQAGNLFNGQTHDWIVAQPSQQGGLSASANFTGINHMDSPEANAVANQVITLLRQPVNSGLFSNAGFNPAPQTYTTPNFSDGHNGEKEQISMASLNITSPADSSTYTPGEQFNVAVTGSPEITEISVIINIPGDSAYYAGTLGTAFNLNFTADTLSGIRNIVAIGKTASGGIILDTLTFFVCPDNYQLNDQVISTSSFSASNTIVSNASIEDESIVKFKAGVSVTLNSGFQVDTGATLEVIMGACDGSNNFGGTGGGAEKGDNKK